jgi:hypothetical protein
MAVKEIAHEASPLTIDEVIPPPLSVNAPDSAVPPACEGVMVSASSAFVDGPSFACEGVPSVAVGPAVTMVYVVVVAGPVARPPDAVVTPAGSNVTVIV